MLTFVATPINRAHYLICSSLLLMRTTGLVFVGKVNNNISPKLRVMHAADTVYQISKMHVGYVLLDLQL